MSEIGCYRHLTVGYLYGWPLHEPLEPVSFGKDRAANVATCSPGELVLGGGDGEWPALVFHRLDYCVARLLASAFNPAASPPNQEVLSMCAEAHMDNEVLEYRDWTFDNHRVFYHSCHSDFTSDIGLATEPCGSVIGFERWLMYCVAEFVYISLPTILPVIERWRRQLGLSGYTFRKIMLPPPGYGADGWPMPPAEECPGLGTFRWEVRDRWPGVHTLENQVDPG